MEKYGLVLEGGGAKGSYHIGAYLALKELGYEFDAVVGTSIGAINGAFIASGEIDKCIYIWKNRTLEASFDRPSSGKIPSVAETLNAPQKIQEIEKLIFNGTIPIEPVKKLVYGSLSEEKIRASKMKFGLVTVNVTDKKAEELFAEDMPEGQLLDYIIASSYLPVFKMEKLNGKYYLDGGFYNRIPFNMVQKLGLKPVIVRVNPPDLKNLVMPKNAIVIQPKEVLNTSLNFSREKADELIELGYNDTIKLLKDLPRE